MSSVEDLETLAKLAHEKPVRAELPALAERILHQRHGINVIPTATEFYQRFEDPADRFTSDVVINEVASSSSFEYELTSYSPPQTASVSYTGNPYALGLNTSVSKGVLSWADVEETTRSQSEIAGHIASQSSSEDVVVVVIVDGLSYYDWTRAGYTAEPVYVDCPTITECGYPNVVYGGESEESLANRLYHEGFKNRVAFTYWEKDDSELTELLHKSFSENDIVGNIQDFDDILSYLNQENWDSDTGTFIQITLTGPERVAHQLKENPDPVHQATVVQKKLTALHEVLSEQESNHRIYATADHGILWRMDAGDDFIPLERKSWDHTKRRHLKNPSNNVIVPEEESQLTSYRGDHYLRLEYPYLFHSLRSNEPGVHGGYSFQESVVPLIELH